MKSYSFPIALVLFASLDMADLLLFTSHFNFKAFHTVLPGLRHLGRDGELLRQDLLLQPQVPGVHLVQAGRVAEDGSGEAGGEAEAGGGEAQAGGREAGPHCQTGQGGCSFSGSNR